MVAAALGVLAGRLQAAKNKHKVIVRELSFIASRMIFLLLGMIS
jgi:hypothetical protein